MAIRQGFGAAVCALLLWACGSVTVLEGAADSSNGAVGGQGPGGASGDGGNGAGGTDPLLMGQFVGPVVGLHYETETQVGETDASGSFAYRLGETVRFSVGGIDLGSTDAAPLVSPFDLADVVPPTAAIDVRRMANRLKSNARAIPFDVAANLAVLLQTVDDDGDPSNGVQIPVALSDVVKTRTVDFHKKYRSFPASFDLRELVGAARSADLWGGTRAIVAPAYALDRWYQYLGLAPEVDTSASFSKDIGINGSVDEKRIYARDPEGNLTSMIVERGAPQLPGTSALYEFGIFGNITKVESDSGHDGTIDARYAYTYDSNGHLIHHEADANADGVPEKVETFTYDANGSLVTTTRDDVPNWSERYTYDARGNPILFERGFDPTPLALEHYSYDQDDNLVRTDWDQDGDGSIDRSEVSEYDADGNRTLVESRDANDVANFRELFAYDAMGNLIRFERQPFVDQPPVFRETYTYDAEGNRTLTERSSQNDVWSREEHTFDSNGNITSSSWDNNADGMSESNRTYSYDSRGNLISQDSHGKGSTRYTNEFVPGDRWRGLRGLGGQ